MNLILNRNFELPADGWHQLAPLGEFPHTAAGIIQAIDVEACTRMVAAFESARAASENFPGLLIDFDHFSLDAEKRSEAAGWITGLKFVSPNSDIGSPTSGCGLFAAIRWSDIGEAAVRGGRYRFLSPVWAKGDCEDLGDNRFRPVRLLNAAVTNDPNLKGILPLSNSRTGAPKGRPPFDSAPLAESHALCPMPNANKEKKMNPTLEALLNKLNLPVDTAEPDVLNAVAALANRAETAEKIVADLQTAQLEADADDFLEANAALIENRAEVRTQFIENRTLTEAVFKNLKAPAAPAPATRHPSPDTRSPLHNRDSRIAATQNRDATTSESKAVKIRNRAAEILKTESVAYTEAFRRAEQEFIN